MRQILKLMQKIACCTYSVEDIDPNDEISSPKVCCSSNVAPLTNKPLSGQRGMKQKSGLDEVMKQKWPGRGNETKVAWTGYL